MRTLEVVMLDKEPDAPLAVLEVGKHGAGQQLLPQRLPEALDLAAGLRMMRPALHVPDAVTLELGLELGGTTPAGVLPALVGQDLARRPILRDPARQGLQHQTAPLVMRQRQTHQITRVIIQERRHVQPLVLAQQEREQVRLPQLVRLGTLEAMLPRLRLGAHLRPRCRQTFIPQHPPHRARRGPQPEVAPQHIPDPTIASTRLRALGRHDRRPSCRRLIGSHQLLAAPARRHQPRLTTLPVLAAPLQQGRVRHPEPRRHFARRQPLFHHRSRRRQAHVPRPARSVPPHRPVSSTRPLRLSLACHLSIPPSPRRQANWRTSAKTLTTRSNAHLVASTALVRGGGSARSRLANGCRESSSPPPAQDYVQPSIP